MKAYEAVIFDLYGTLIDELMHPEANRMVYVRTRNEMADMLGVDREGFAKEWTDAFFERMAGVFPSTEAVLAHICRQLGAKPDKDRIAASAERRLEYSRRSIVPRPGVLETLAALRSKRYKVGLISNCTEEVSLLWESTPFASMFDVAILSFDVGLAKPDPRIYALASERLGVEAKDCLYVGDGSDGELSGATRAGMTAVLMRAPYDAADGGRESWEGRRISSIAEVWGWCEGSGGEFHAIAQPVMGNWTDKTREGCQQ